MRKRYIIVGGMFVYLWTQLFGESVDETSEFRTRSHTPIRETVNQNSPLRPPISLPGEPTLQQPTRESKTIQTSASGIRKVSGNRVALRQGPSTNFPILDRFDRGREVTLLETKPDWSLVRDKLTQREGWMATRYLSSQLDFASQKPKKNAKRPADDVRKTVTLSNSAIIKQIIAESIARYPGSCPCPYNTDRAGRRCGARSAYSRPGGYAPVCFAQDVSNQMISAFRRGR